ncbi:hypothetical protein DYE50_10285 [Treponema ruminis]|uniref:Lipoprotein n=1 Tax=Treponema ruminis TaxID=744515 RepID=A0A7W8LM48_9SPIR|nr:hypothetical protein [Treponema ruminis]MBB5226141.1 hypothetical protein [Treponema ruminis]QSI02951.1 hypothetical protein DYE50_10285 [Treponema ruminis]
MKKLKVLSAALTALLLAASFGFTSCSSDDDDDKKTSQDLDQLTSSSISDLNEAIIKANAYLEADSSLSSLKSNLEKAEKVLSSKDSKDSEAKILITGINSVLESTKSVKITETAFKDLAGPGKSRTYKGLFAPTILKSEYDSTWLKYITPLIGSEAAEATAKMLKSSISGPTYGKNLSAEQKAAGLFNCELHPENSLLTFAVTSDGKYSLSEGTNTYTYEYLGISHMGKNDDWHALFPSMFKEGQSTSFDCAVYKAKEENAGEYKYLLLCPDTPEKTYHIEFRYGSNINDLQSALSGEYAFWLAAGIPNDADSEMIENVIKLFVEENLADMAEYSYALVNIPFETFFKEEAIEFDAYSSATTKAAAGNMSYGTYHTQTTASEATTRGITYPVKIAKASLSSLTGNKITDDTASFEITTTGRGASTIRYKGKQNLFQSADYSYYLLKDEPAYYKELSVIDGKVSAGKIVGEAKEIKNLYVTIAAGEAHHDFSPAITIYVDDPNNAGKVTKLTFSDEADKAEKITDAGTSEQVLSALKAIVATSAEGKSYGLTTLSNIFWGKSQIGFKAPKDKDYYPQHALVGKEVTSLTFITEKGLYVAKNIKVGSVATDAETKLLTFTANSGDEAKFVIPNLQGK